jgi:hypothetical protein
LLLCFPCMCGRLWFFLHSPHALLLPLSSSPLFVSLCSCFTCVPRCSSFVPPCPFAPARLCSVLFHDAPPVFPCFAICVVSLFSP